MKKTTAARSRILELFLTFLRIGAFTFGGGYAMLPLIQRETVEEKGWISDEDILEVVAIAESTPGPIAINSATFVGYRVAGFAGAFWATLGVVLPSFVVISVISLILSEFSELRVVKYAFLGIRAGVLALLIKALISMLKKSERTLFALLISIGAFVFAGIFDFNTIIILIVSALLGFAVSVAKARKHSSKK